MDAIGLAAVGVVVICVYCIYLIVRKLRDLEREKTFNDLRDQKMSNIYDCFCFIQQQAHRFMQEPALFLLTTPSQKVDNKLGFTWLI